jgi:hypothetical protein
MVLGNCKMTIGMVQMEALEASLREAFVERAAKHFSRHFAEKAKEAGWKQRLEEAIARAERTYGLELERDLLTFVSLCGQLGWGFEQRADNAWMRECLLDRRVSRAEERMSLLLERMRRRVEIEARNEAMRAEFRARKGARPMAAAV